MGKIDGQFEKRQTSRSGLDDFGWIFPLRYKATANTTNKHKKNVPINNNENKIHQLQEQAFSKF
jgi:hypothetical protein